MARRKKGHRIGIDPHPTRDWTLDVPGHKNHNGTVVKGKFCIKNLKERLDHITKELREKEESQPSENKTGEELQGGNPEGKEK